MLVESLYAVAVCTGGPSTGLPALPLPLALHRDDMYLNGGRPHRGVFGSPKAGLPHGGNLALLLPAWLGACPENHCMKRHAGFLHGACEIASGRRGDSCMVPDAADEKFVKRVSELSTSLESVCDTTEGTTYVRSTRYSQLTSILRNDTSVSGISIFCVNRLVEAAPSFPGCVRFIDVPASGTGGPKKIVRVNGTKPFQNGIMPTLSTKVWGNSTVLCAFRDVYFALSPPFFLFYRSTWTAGT